MILQIALFGVDGIIRSDYRKLVVIIAKISMQQDLNSNKNEFNTQMHV